MERTLLVRGAGLALIFVSLVVFPYFGVSPLEMTGAVPVNGGRYDVLSAFYDPSGYLHFTLSVLPGTSGGQYVYLHFPEDRSNQLGFRDVKLYAYLREQYLEYVYRRSSSLPDVIVVRASGRDRIGYLLSNDDMVKAFEDAVSKIKQTLGGSPSSRCSKYIYDVSYRVDGGDAVADVVLYCVVPDAFSVFQYSGYSRYATLSVFFGSSDNRFTNEVVIPNVVGSGSSFELVSSGRSVGVVQYQGELEGYAPPEDFTPEYLYIVKRVGETGATGLYFARGLDEYLFRVQQLEFTPSAGSCSSYDIYRSLISIDPHVTLRSFLTYNTPWSVGVYDCGTSVDYDTSVRAVQSFRDNLFSVPVASSSVYRLTSVSPDSVSLRKVYTGEYPLAGYVLSFVLDANWVGVEYIRADPRIVSVDVDECTVTDCTLYVTVQNVGKYSGSVDVHVYSDYTMPAARSVVLDPGESARLSFAIYFTKRIDSPTDVRFRVEAVALHPIDPVKVSSSRTVAVKPSEICDIPEGKYRCVLDENGVWHALYCPNPYVSPAEKVCSEGQVCLEGVGCTYDVVQSVECVPGGYVLHYQYSGDKFGTCPSGYVCDENLAASGSVPPCVEYRGRGREDGGKKLVVHVQSDVDYMKAFARGLLLIGLGLVLW